MKKMKFFRFLLLAFVFLLPGMLLAQESHTINVGGPNLTLSAPSSTNSRHPDFYDAQWRIVSQNPAHTIYLLCTTCNPAIVQAGTAGTARVSCTARYYNKDKWTDPMYTGYTTVSRYYDITVNDPNAPTRVDVSPSSLSLDVGGKRTLKATVYPTTASQSVIWSS